MVSGSVAQQGQQRILRHRHGDLPARTVWRGGAVGPQRLHVQQTRHDAARAAVGRHRDHSGLLERVQVQHWYAEPRRELGAGSRGQVHSPGDHRERSQVQWKPREGEQGGCGAGDDLRRDGL